MASTRDTSRRRVLGASAFVGGCVLLCPRPSRGAAFAAKAALPAFDERIGYCCADCTAEKCDFLSTKPEVKRRKAAELSRKLGREVTAEQVTCSRCRVRNESALASIRGCAIRKCVVEKKVASCAHCSELPSCSRANPITKERALALRQQLLASSAEAR